MDKSIIELKSEVFDILRAQDELKVQLQQLEQLKRQKLEELEKKEQENVKDPRSDSKDVD